ncbi:putative PAS/PAC sensor protein [Oscillochloris trichoides DG-6]|uniref:PAS/PAC sensor protein n=1 Tax=Oscillochloris trichoides DG-6 TaxID=765420 RepID=E1IE27_9CHLR|nr:HD-GYP domain-containing protein [Oscillochloris trichoides]EFO80569.1 putative PAS/PAC sensor protein [Oscillochloris trichoides DG-6]
MQKDRGHRRFAVRITMIYALIGTLWIMVSDILLVYQAQVDDFQLSVFSIAKGLFYVVITASILFWLLWGIEDEIFLKSSALDAAANAIVISDINGKIEWVNPAFAQLTGYTVDEAKGQTTRLLRSGQHEDQFYKQLWDTILADQVWHGVMVNRRKDGTLYDEEQTITPVKDARGAIRHFIAIKQDISERREHELAIQDAHQALADAYDATIVGWSRALDMRDQETQGHSERVTELTVRLARAMGVDEEEIEHIRRGALLHDIGKMGIPDAVLLKAGPLTNEEWSLMRMHPIYSYELLKQIGFLRPALPIPISHHERWDGQGYPAGLKGEQIPLPARIFAVIDVWDALTNDRPYRKAWPPERARDYIVQQAGIHFDPEVVKIFLEHVDAWIYHGERRA